MDDKSHIKKNLLDLEHNEILAITQFLLLVITTFDVTLFFTSKPQEVTTVTNPLIFQIYEKKLETIFITFGLALAILWWTIDKLKSMKRRINSMAHKTKN